MDRDCSKKCFGNILQKTNPGLPAVKIIRQREKKSTKIHAAASAWRPITENDMHSKYRVLHTRIEHDYEAVIKHMGNDFIIWSQTYIRKTSTLSMSANKNNQATSKWQTCWEFERNDNTWRLLWSISTENIQERAFISDFQGHTPQVYKCQSIKGRDEVLANRQNLISWLERNWGQMGKRMHIDQADEFLSMNKNLEKKT